MLPTDTGWSAVMVSVWRRRMRTAWIMLLGFSLLSGVVAPMPVRVNAVQLARPLTTAATPISPMPGYAGTWHRPDGTIHRWTRQYGPHLPRLHADSMIADGLPRHGIGIGGTNALVPPGITLLPMRREPPIADPAMNAFRRGLWDGYRARALLPGNPPPPGGDHAMWNRCASLISNLMENTGRFVGSGLGSFIGMPGTGMITTGGMPVPWKSGMPGTSRSLRSHAVDVRPLIRRDRAALEEFVIEGAALKAKGMLKSNFAPDIYDAAYHSFSEVWVARVPDGGPIVGGMVMKPKSTDPTWLTVPYLQSHRSGTGTLLLDTAWDISQFGGYQGFDLGSAPSAHGFYQKFHPTVNPEGGYQWPYRPYR